MASICGAIDWGATGTMLSGAGSILGAFAIVLAAWIGSNTFKKWKLQRTEERRIDVAEQILTMAYRLEWDIQAIRSPFTSASELFAAEEILRKNNLLNDVTPSWRKNNLETAQVVFARAQNNDELWKSLSDLLPIAKAIFGADVEGSLRVYFKHRTKILAAAKNYSVLQNEEDARTQEAADNIFKKRERFEGVIWESAEEGDPFSVGITATTTALESILLPVIRSDSKLG